jgi:hypothetical protein
VSKDEAAHDVKLEDIEDIWDAPPESKLEPFTNFSRPGSSQSN